MANGKDLIEIYTLSPTTMYGRSLTEKISIIDQKQYTNKRTNIFDPNILQGIGIVSGKATAQDREEFNYIKNKILIGNKSNIKRNPRLNAIGVNFEKDDVLLSHSLSMASSLDQDFTEISQWIRKKNKDFLLNDKFKIETGFLVSYQLSKLQEYYRVELKFKNLSQDKIEIKGIKKWSKLSTDHVMRFDTVKLKVMDEEESEVYLLNENNVADDKDNNDIIVIESNGETIINFIIPEIKLVNKKQSYSYITLDLDVISPPSISGSFSYSTNLIELLNVK